MVMGVKSSEPGPELPENATNAQKVAAWRPFLAEAAEYEADETTITCKAIVLKDPNVKPGDVMTFEYRFEGDYLIQIFKDTENYPRANQFILKYSRLE